MKLRLGWRTFSTRWHKNLIALLQDTDCPPVVWTFILTCVTHCARVSLCLLFTSGSGHFDPFQNSPGLVRVTGDRQCSESSLPLIVSCTLTVWRLWFDITNYIQYINTVYAVIAHTHNLSHWYTLFPAAITAVHPIRSSTSSSWVQSESWHFDIVN